MQTVNFRCGNCNNLMAVSVDYLGQQVRCPHCQSVVVAPVSNGPAAVPTPSAVPASTVEPKTEENPFQATVRDSEDIFSQPSAMEDSLFDEPTPKLELPPVEPLEPRFTPSLEPTPAPLDHAPLDPPVPSTPVLAAFQEAYESAPLPGQTPMESSPIGSELNSNQGGGIVTPWSEPSENGQVVADAIPRPVRKPRESGKINWFIPLVFIPILLWAVLATAAAALLYMRISAARPSMFDQMPDIEGDTPGVRPGKKKVGLAIDRKMAMQTLPAHLHVALGASITVGDLEVTPTTLQRRRVWLFAEGAEEKAEPSLHDALVLNLRLKNVAEDYAFTPLDNYFDRRYAPSVTGKPPLTFLEAGDKTFFGGPAKWLPLDRDTRKGERREWLDGRKNVDREGLAPGESTETYVCTDGWDPSIALHLFGVDENGKSVGKGYRGNLLWRVHLRRGLVTYKGKNVPATAVIGVEFSGADIPQQEASNKEG